MGPVKEEARKLVDALPDDATWEDLMYAIYAHQKITAGQEAAARGRVVPHRDTRRRATKK